MAICCRQVVRCPDKMGEKLEGKREAAVSPSLKSKESMKQPPADTGVAWVVHEETRSLGTDAISLRDMHT